MGFTGPQAWGVQGQSDGEGAPPSGARLHLVWCVSYIPPANNLCHNLKCTGWSTRSHTPCARAAPAPHRGSLHCCRICCQEATRHELAAADCRCAACPRPPPRASTCRHRTAVPSAAAAVGARLCCTAPLLLTAPPPLPAADGSAAQVRPIRAAARRLNMAAVSLSPDPEPLQRQVGCRRAGRQEGSGQLGAGRVGAPPLVSRCNWLGSIAGASDQANCLLWSLEEADLAVAAGSRHSPPFRCLASQTLQPAQPWGKAEGRSASAAALCLA